MRKASLGTLFLTAFIDLLGFGLVVPFLPGVARDLGASDVVATLLGAAYSLMQFLFIPFWGRLSDRFGRRPILLVSIAACSVGMATLGFANSLPLFFAARLFSGAATANLAVAQAYIADITTPETRARGMGIIGMAFGLGFILGPMVGGILGQITVFGRLGPAAAFAAATLSVINFFMAVAFVPESLQPHLRQASRKRSSPLDLGSLRQMRSVAGLGLAAVLSLVLTFFFSGLEVTFRLFTEDAFGMTVTGTGYCFVLVGAVAAITQGGLIGSLSRRFGEVRLMFMGLLVLAVGFAIVGGSYFLGRGASAIAIMLVGAACVAFGNGLTIPSLSSYASRKSGPTFQGVSLGVLQSLGALARGVGPFFAGPMYQFVGPWAPYLSGAVGLVLVATLARRLPPIDLRDDGVPLATTAVASTSQPA